MPSAIVSINTAAAADPTLIQVRGVRQKDPKNRKDIAMNAINVGMITACKEMS